jgi:hypothetical protein
MSCQAPARASGHTARLQIKKQPLPAEPRDRSIYFNRYVAFARPFSEFLQQHAKEHTPRSTRQPRYGLLSPCLACSQGTFGSPCTGIHYEEIQTVNNCVCVADRKLPSNAIIDMPSSICHTALRPLRKASHPMTEAHCCEILTNRLSTRLGKGREKE